VTDQALIFTTHHFNREQVMYARFPFHLDPAKHGYHGQFLFLIG